MKFNNEIVRLVNDPIYKDGRCKFTVAQNYFSNNERKTNFWNCTAFSKTATNIYKSAKKGHRLIVSGTISNNNYEMNGVKRYEVYVTVFNAVFVEKRVDPMPPNDFKPSEHVFTVEEDDLPF